MRLKSCFCLVTVFILLCGCILSGFAENDAADTEVVKFKNYKEALAYVQNNQPALLNVGKVNWKIDQLYGLKQAMPEGGQLAFTFTWCGAQITQADTEADLNSKTPQITGEQLEMLIDLCPGLRRLVVSKHRELTNPTMVPLLEKYPGIDFVWLVALGQGFTIRSDATAWSSQKTLSDKRKLTSANCENLRYVPGLRALDLGHNGVTSLDFLSYFPEMRILILADNKITDIAPIANLEHLEYVELFMNHITDITPLTGLRELKDLNLCRTKMKGVDLSPLDVLDLERFWCTQADVSKEEQARFIEANPETLCNFTVGSCTDMGWRDSYKYKQYRTMFKTFTWSEFVPPEK